MAIKLWEALPGKRNHVKHVCQVSVSSMWLVGGHRDVCGKMLSAEKLGRATILENAVYTLFSQCSPLSSFYTPSRHFVLQP